MTVEVFLALLIANNLVWMWLSDRSAKRNNQQIDKLTTKIIAPQTVSAIETSPDTKLQPGGISINRTEVPLAEADPEEVMHAIAVELGREEK